MGLAIVSSQGGMSDSARGIFSFTLILTERSSFILDPRSLDCFALWVIILFWFPFALCGRELCC
jgi:hypothetical protein